ncbi:Putative pentatricopeptide repeat-containing protein [Glycine soja]|uniref:Putative pentatricopeptide repeat-containing protein n=1 Tax=Glycine soja TaxID=3848 RepID=A0A0B2SJQ5_GLYSO|nr:Putative pentatricopeptide repeat-containing protein [Glycine soja]
MPTLQPCNALLHGLVKTQMFDSLWEVYVDMMSRRFSPTVITYGILMNCCCAQGDFSNAQKGQMGEAEGVFGRMRESGVVTPNLYTYKTLMDGYSMMGDAGDLLEAMWLRLEMERCGIFPDVVTYNILIKGLCDIFRLEEAMGLMEKMDEVEVLANSVIQCGNVRAAMGLYTEMVIKGIVPDVVTYTALIDGHCKVGNTKEAFRLHKEMLDAGLSPNMFTVSCVIDGLLKDGRTNDAIKMFLEKTGAGYPRDKMDSSVNKLVHGNISMWHQKAETPISLKPPKANQTLKKHLECNIHTKVLLLFRFFLRKRPTLNLIDSYSLLYALKACNHKHSSTQGKQLHALIIKFGYQTIVQLQITLLKTYAQRVHGQAREALQLFSEMRDKDDCVLTPNDVTFIGVLMACSHAGMVEEGKLHFRKVGGHLRDSYDFIMEMPVPPNAVVWRTLLGACSVRGELELAAEVRQKLLKLDPGYVVDSVAMSNIYANKGMWNKKIVVKNQIKQSRAPGCSSIEVGSGVSEFVVSDDNHPLMTDK